MGLFTTQPPPHIPRPPDAYDKSFFAKTFQVLNLYFTQLNGIQPINIGQLNIDINTLPTDADVANLRVGDVYREVATDYLKIKI